MRYPRYVMVSYLFLVAAAAGLGGLILYRVAESFPSVFG